MARTKQTARARTTTASISLTNLSAGETIHQRALLLKGQINLPPTSAPPTSSPSFITITTSDNNDDALFPPQTWPLTPSGHFKALVLLAPGPNTLRIDWDNDDLNDLHSATLSIPVTYLPLLQTPPLHLAVLVAADSPLLIDCPPHKAAGISTAHGGLDAAVRKLRLAAYMWQAGTAEDLRAKGLGRRAFRLEEEFRLDTVSSVFLDAAYENELNRSDGLFSTTMTTANGAGRCSPYAATAKVHVVRTERTVAELRSPTNRARLRGWFCDALRNHGGFTGPDAVVAGLVLDSHYSATQDAILANPPQPGSVEKDAASGISLAAFGSHTCWAWPRFVEEVASCLLDSTTTTSATGGTRSGSGVSIAETDGSSVFRYDSAWQACAFGQALMLRGVGRALIGSRPPPALDVQAAIEDAMTYATQRNYATAFMPSISRRGQQLLDYGITGSEQLWDLRDALALRCVPHLRILSDAGAAVVAEQARGGAPVVQAYVVNGEVELRVSVEGSGGLARIVLAGMDEECPSVAEPEDMWRCGAEELEERFGREGTLEVRAVAMNGKERVVTNVWALLARSAFVKVPGSKVVLQKQSVRSGELEAQDDDSERNDKRPYWEWTAMLRERGADGKLTHATSFDMRVGCILDGGVLRYADGHKTHLGPRVDVCGNDHHFGGHASEKITLTPGVDVGKVEIHKTSYDLIGMRTTLADGTVRGELHENDGYCSDGEIVVLEPGLGHRIVGFFGRSDWNRSFNGIQEFGIITVPVHVGVPECVYDMAELKNTDGGLEDVRSFFNKDGSRKRSVLESEDNDAEQYSDEEWDNNRD